jgi:signal transduction histidine kinase
MKDLVTQARRAPARWTNLFQAQDFAWLLFVAVLLVTIPETNYNYTILMVLIGAFQIIEPRLPLFASRRGQIASVALKLVLCYLLIGWTHGIASLYYLIFLIPVVSGATIFDLPGVLIVTGIACGAYLSFLLPVFTQGFTFPADYPSILELRVSFYAIVAFLVYQQAKAKRDEMKRTQEAAERLAESNRSLREAQVSLRRSERLAALGQLTAGLAHELRNPLGTIRASAEMLTKNTLKDRPEVMSEMAGYIGSEADRMSGLISKFLDFARPLQVNPVPAELRPVLTEVVREQSELARKTGVTVSVDMPDAPLQFTFDPELLRLAISNLVQNAIQASTAGQSVEVRVAESEKNIMIFVSDHGHGIPKEQLENIFNPFFTTKAQGIGLGLAVVSKIIDEHRGALNVFSEVGKGTTFEISLPRTEGS